MSNEIKTTVVGSYPVPEWLRMMPTSGNLRDAVIVVMKTQELAGIDVISDGELSRFDVNHPETNGMIDYFIGPMSGINTALSRSEMNAFLQQEGLGFRTQPAGVVRDKIGAGTLNLQSSYENVARMTRSPLKFTVTSPYMLAKTLLDDHYGDLAELVNAIAGVLAKQVEDIDASVLQVDEANLPGSPQDAEIAAAGAGRSGSSREQACSSGSRRLR